jgi:hypothetical protein
MLSREPLASRIGSNKGCNFLLLLAPAVLISLIFESDFAAFT